jgi:hypothetical protein
VNIYIYIYIYIYSALVGFLDKLVTLVHGYEQDKLRKIKSQIKEIRGNIAKIYKNNASRIVIFL